MLVIIVSVTFYRIFKKFLIVSNIKDEHNQSTGMILQHPELKSMDMMSIDDRNI